MLKVFIFGEIDDSAVKHIKFHASLWKDYMKEKENSNPAMQLLIKALIDGDRIQAVSEARKLCGAGIGHEKIIKEGIEVAMTRLDDICTMEQFNLLQIMLAGRSVMAVMELLYPAGTFPPATKGTVVLGTLEGDVHDLGKNILKMVMVGKGYRVVDCGKNCPIEKIIDTLEKEDAIAVGISGLITVVIPIVRKVRDIITSQGLGHIKVMAGGAALKQGSPLSLNVDFVAETAFDGTRYLDQITGEKK